jgi:hypothetical protein
MTETETEIETTLHATIATVARLAARIERIEALLTGLYGPACLGTPRIEPAPEPARSVPTQRIHAPPSGFFTG